MISVAIVLPVPDAPENSATRPRDGRAEKPHSSYTRSPKR